MVKSQLIDLSKSIGLRVLGLFIGFVVVELMLNLAPAEALNSLTSYYHWRAELYQTDSQIGWRLKPNATTRYTFEDQFDVRIQVNSLGLNDIEHPYHKPPGTFRILLLGDSMTESLSVPIQRGFPHLLEVCLDDYYPQPIEVINGGIVNYSSAEELFFLQHEGLRYEPDLVLVTFYIGNDLDAYVSRETNDGWFDSVGGYLIELDEAEGLKRTWVDWQNPSPYENVSTFELWLRRLKTYQVVAHPNSQFYNWFEDYTIKMKRQPLEKWLNDLLPASRPAQAAQTDDFRENFSLMIYLKNFPNNPDTPPKLIENWAIINKVFNEIQAIADRENITLGALILPEKVQASEREYQVTYQKYASRYSLDIAGLEWDYLAPNRALTQLFTEKNIPNFDLLTTYRGYDAQYGTPIFFHNDPHLNEIGHQLTAEAICQWLIERNFVAAD